MMLRTCGTWHDGLYEESYTFFYGAEDSPKNPSKVAYWWRILAIFPSQCVITFCIICLMVTMTFLFNSVTVPLGIGLFWIEGNHLYFRLNFRGRTIYLWTILIPFYMLCLSALLFGVWNVMSALLGFGMLCASVYFLHRYYSHLVKKSE